MIIVSHRRNTIEELESTPSNLGVEVDIRSQSDELIIHHDPFSPGVSFAKWLDSYKHKLLILNVKEEGLEERIIQLMAKKEIENYFFLDQSFPFLIKWANKGERRLAIRVSEYESIETALNLRDKIQWAWIDCFTRFPLSEKNIDSIKSSGLKLCIVSPELQGRNADTEVPEMRNQIKALDLKIDAVCTKRVDLWQ
jgi:hypothetical protein